MAACLINRLKCLGIVVSILRHLMTSPSEAHPSAGRRWKRKENPG